jgi:O-antigen ligase
MTPLQSEQPWTLPVVLVVVLWTIVLFDPDVWLASLGAVAARRVPTVLHLALLGLIVLQAPRARQGAWLLPFLAFLVNASLTVQFAENTGMARAYVWKTLLLYYILAVGTLAFVKTAGKVRVLLLLFLGQFLYWSAQGLASEATMGSTTWQPIPWHPILGNTDSFAPLMVIGMGFSYYYAQATRSNRWRWIAFVTGVLCLIGVVAAFTRGASVAAAAVALYICLRAPHKGRAFVWLAVAVAAVWVATSVIYPEGEFWDRLSTITSEGTHAGTGADRWNLWRLGWRVFVERPLFGVGAGNFGTYAFAHVPADDLLGRYAHNRWFLYGRVLHSVHVEVLVELGIVGVACYLWMLVDFWKRNAALRSPALGIAWTRATGGKLDLRIVALGLEAGMVAFLITGCFYDQLFVHWLYSLVTLNGLLYATATRLTLGPGGPT